MQVVVYWTRGDVGIEQKGTKSSKKKEVANLHVTNKLKVVPLKYYSTPALPGCMRDPKEHAAHPAS